MRVNFQRTGVLIQHIWSQYLALKNDPRSIFNPSQILCYSASNSLWQPSPTPSLLVWLVTSPTELLITREGGKGELSGDWKEMLWVDEAHQSWRTAHLREKKPYPRPSLPCGHTHIWERLGEGNTNIKSQMGGLCSTSSDGKQPMKESPNIKPPFLEVFRGLRMANNPT